MAVAGTHTEQQALTSALVSVCLDCGAQRLDAPRSVSMGPFRSITAARFRSGPSFRKNSYPSGVPKSKGPNGPGGAPGLPMPARGERRRSRAAPARTMQ